MIKSTAIPVLSLFTNNMNAMFIDYNKVRYSFKELLLGSTEFILNDAYKQIKKYVKIISDNPKIMKFLELSDYEVMKDLAE